MTLLVLSVAAYAGDPVWFEYAFTRDVGSGTGTYAGYTDQTRSTGRYSVSDGFPGVDVYAHYEWSYTSSSEPPDDGVTNRYVTYSPMTWRYTSTIIDLDDAEWNGVDPATLAPWFRIATTVQVGDDVQLLDQPCHVDLVEPVSTPAGDRPAIRCTSTGSGRRNDTYGYMATTWTETSWFDQQTGFIVKQAREERDEGTIQGESGTFVMTEKLTLTDASFAPAPTPPPPSLMETALALVFTVALLVGPVLLTVLILGTVAYAVYRLIQPPTSVATAAYGKVAIKRATSAIEVTRFSHPLATQTFAPFLEDFITKALAAGDVVALATAGGDSLVGVALADRETSLGTLFAPDTTVAKALLRWIGGNDFFSETRHKDGERNAFNVYETFKVMRLTAIPDLAYDTALVTQARLADLAELVACLKEVHPKLVATSWMGVTLASSDLVFVARVDNVIVGFGVATLCGEHGRLHGLAVRPKHRDKGIGKELVRARLAALKSLGATDVISEISETAPASLHIAREVGFAESGIMFVETTDELRIERAVVRR